MPNKLNAGESAVPVANPLVFQVKNVQEPAQGDGLRAIGIMDHRAVMERVLVEFESVAVQKSDFAIRYPVELSPVRSASAIAHGEESPIVLEVINYSNCSLGRDSETGRVLRIRIGMANRMQVSSDIDTVGRNALILREENGVICEGEELFVEIPNLPANARTFIRASLAFQPTVENYHFAAICISLDLGDIKEYRSYKTIQQRVIQIQLTESYTHNPEARMLLVINNRSTKDEIGAWRQLLSSFQMQLSVYNLSLYHGLQMDYKRQSDSRSLIDDFAGKGFVVLLNNDCRDHYSEELRSPYRDLCKLYPLQLFRQYRIRLLILGPLKDVDAQSIGTPWLRACTEQNPVLLFRSAGAFLKTGFDRIPYRLLKEEQSKSLLYSSSTERINKRISRTTSAKILLQSTKRPLSISHAHRIRSATSSSIMTNPSQSGEDRRSSVTFMNVSEEGDVVKPAHLDADLSGFFFKERKASNPLKSLPRNGWQKRFLTIRLKDRALSWYLNGTEKIPQGILDLNDLVTVEEVPPSKGKSSWFAFCILTSSRGIVVRTKDEEQRALWMQKLLELKETLEALKGQSDHDVASEDQKSDKEGAIDDVFCGWVKRKGLVQTKLFLMLRLHDRTLSCYKADNLATPVIVIQCHNITATLGWKAETTELSAKQTEENSESEEELENGAQKVLQEEGENENVLSVDVPQDLQSEKGSVNDAFQVDISEEAVFQAPRDGDELDRESLRFTVTTKQKRFWFSCSMEGQPSAQEWIDHLNRLEESQELAILSSLRYLSSIPERHALISATEKIIFFRKPKGAHLQSHAKSLATALWQYFPGKNFLIVLDFLATQDNATELKSGSRLRPKYMLGTLKVMECLPCYGGGVNLHSVADHNLHLSSFILSEENSFYVWSAIPFYEKLIRLRQVDGSDLPFEMTSALTKSIVSDVIAQIRAFSHSHKLTTSQIKYSLGNLRLTVEFDWVLPGESRILQGSALEASLIYIIAALKALFKASYTVRNSIRDQGGLKKILQSSVKCLSSSATIGYEKEEAKVFKAALRQQTRDLLSTLPKDLWLTRYAEILAFPFRQEEGAESAVHGSMKRARQIDNETYEQEQTAELGRNGMQCQIAESANKCNSNQDRYRLFGMLEARFTVPDEHS